MIARFEIRMLADHNFADRPAAYDILDLEGIGVSFNPDHAAPHIRVDRHVEISDLDFAVFGFWYIHSFKRERLLCRQTLGDFSQADIRGLQGHEALLVPEIFQPCVNHITKSGAIEFTPLYYKTTNYVNIGD